VPRRPPRPRASDPTSWPGSNRTPPRRSGKGDHALALQTIIQPGLLRHPASIPLTELRRTALHRLMEAHQQTDPFKFLIYAELAGAEIGPVQ
jgi:hypothetical protein